ncbi:hypothetical protein RJ641_004889 [Dillenia turbinata]|uniref:Uncharacterized protein n=1 Tax=Dillenia turbinata TaxID=194707 RepID=A0AAN8VBT8_9MAGN
MEGLVSMIKCVNSWCKVTPTPVKIRVLKLPNQVGLDGFLQGGNSRTLEMEIGLEVLRDIMNQTLKWEFADEKLSAPLLWSRAASKGASPPVDLRANCWDRAVEFGDGQTTYDLPSVSGQDVAPTLSNYHAQPTTHNLSTLAIKAMVETSK